MTNFSAVLPVKKNPTFDWPCVTFSCYIGTLKIPSLSIFCSNYFLFAVTSLLLCSPSVYCFIHFYLLTCFICFLISWGFSSTYFFMLSSLPIFSFHSYFIIFITDHFVYSLELQLTVISTFHFLLLSPLFTFIFFFCLLPLF